MRKILALLLVVVTCVSAIAQPPMEAPAELKSLGWMVGTWEGTISMDIEGMKMEAKTTMKCASEGMFIRQDFTMDAEGMKMSEVSYIGWDAEKKKYSMYTFASWAPTPRIEWGEFKGNDFVSISEPWASGMPEKTVSRSTLKKVSNSEVGFVLEFKMGDKWVKVGSGTFKKKA